MIYSLLHKNIRKQVRREEVKSFDDLLRLARTAEESLVEEPRAENKYVPFIPKFSQADKRKDRPRCQFCGNFGHLKADCKKFAKTKVDNTNSTAVLDTRPSVSCYGCGAPGVIRSKCPTCRPNETAATPSNSAGFCSIDAKQAVRPRPRPVFQVSIHGVTGTGFADTAAQCSVASQSLYQLLVSKGQEFQKVSLVTTFADGESRTSEVLTTTVDDQLANRIIATSFIVLPEARKNRTLFGIDFLSDARIDLNVARRTWYFDDAPGTVYDLQLEDVSDTDAAEVAAAGCLRPEEGSSLSVEQRSKLEQLLQQNEDIFSKGGEPTPYAEHRIETGNYSPPN